MNKILTLLSFLFIVNPFLLAQDLPKGMTDEEKIIWQTYKPEFNPAFSTPPPTVVRTMAEWEELQAIIITWTQYQSILREIVRHAQKECKVYIICSNISTVRNYLTSGGVPIENIEFLIFPFNSIWVRDYGPWTVYSTGSDSINIIDWVYNRPRPDDDNISVLFADTLDLPIYQTTSEPYRLVNTGGNFMADGLGTAFSSKLIFDENPTKTEEQIDNIMNLFMGINRFIKMENLRYDVIHHIDMHMKLLDEETLLVGEYPEGVSDGPYIEANLKYILNNFLTPYGKPYRVVRILMPPDKLGKYPDAGGDYRTYTNSLIVNKTILVPTYEEKYDTTALRIYREAMPGYNIVGINCDNIISLNGAIHCITKEVGAQNPLLISHSRIRDTVSINVPVEVRALVKNNSGISATKLFWTTDTTQGYNAIEMTYLGGDTLAAIIPAQLNKTEVFYFISATSNNGKTISKPMTAPSGYYKFYIDDPTSVNIASGIGSIEYFGIEQNYPNPFNPSTVIKYQIPFDTQVKLKVFDILGNEIETLVNEYKSAGSYNIQFNADNLASGVYFYRIQAGNFSQSMKMILMR